MLRVIVLIVLLLHMGVAVGCCSERIHKNSILICSQIITELTEGKVNLDQAEAISYAIANAANNRFGKVSCGDMWLYMAIVHVESGFRNNIINYHNCRGMFQVHAPSWASKFGLKYGDLLDLDTNADCGIQIYQYYLTQYKDVVPALSAYNSDNPSAAISYARAVLGAKAKIKKRYIELYKHYQVLDRLASRLPDPTPVPASYRPANGSK